MATELPSFGAAALKVVAAIGMMKKVQEETLEQIGELVTKTAYAKFGVYQSAVGPYAAWAPLTDVTKERRLALGTTEDQPLFRPGLPGSEDGVHLRDTVSFDVDSSTDTVTIGSTSQIMLDHELGQESLPPRAVLGPALWERKKEIVGLVYVNYAAAMTAAFGGRKFLGVDLLAKQNIPGVTFGGLRAADDLVGVPF